MKALIIRYLIKKAIGYALGKVGITSSGAADRLTPGILDLIGKAAEVTRRIKAEYKTTDDQAATLAIEYVGAALTTPSATVDTGLEEWMQGRTPGLNEG